MILYEVNLEVDKDIANEYQTWLKEHVGHMLQLDGFESAQIFSRDPKDEGLEISDKVLLTVHYHLKERASLENYFKNHAEKMRAEGLQKFPGKFKATRRILLPNQ
ncbi:MAG: DUF4286 family protein [Deltaproteobacteria bacterium]|nr:DUF4286 family protein [Deltaproteobacteria bacterium]